MIYSVCVAKKKNIFTLTGDNVFQHSPLCYCMYMFTLSHSLSQLKVSRGVVSVVFNGGWNYPGVEYVWKRIFSEITTDPHPQTASMSAFAFTLLKFCMCNVHTYMYVDLHMSP